MTGRAVVCAASAYRTEEDRIGTWSTGTWSTYTWQTGAAIRTSDVVDD